MSRAEGGLGVRGVRGESWGGEQLELQGLGRSAGLGELAAWSLREREKKRKKKRRFQGNVASSQNSCAAAFLREVLEV